MKNLIFLLSLSCYLSVASANSPWSSYTMTYLDRLLITMEMKEPEFEGKYFLIGFRKKGKATLLVEIEKSNQFYKLEKAGLKNEDKRKMKERRQELETILTKDITREMKAFGIQGLKIKFVDL